jgi:hypothetical protein
VSTQTTIALPEGRADDAAPLPVRLFVACARCRGASCVRCYGTGMAPRDLTDAELQRAVLDGAMAADDVAALVRWQEARGVR